MSDPNPLSFSSSLYGPDGLQHIDAAAAGADAGPLRSLLQPSRVDATHSNEGSFGGLLSSAATAAGASTARGATSASPDTDAAARDRFCMQHLAALHAHLVSAGINALQFIEVARAAVFGLVTTATALDEHIRRAVAASQSARTAALAAFAAQQSYSPGGLPPALEEQWMGSGRVEVCRACEVSVVGMQALFESVGVRLSEPEARCFLYWSYNLAVEAAAAAAVPPEGSESAPTPIVDGATVAQQQPSSAPSRPSVASVPSPSVVLLFGELHTIVSSMWRVGVIAPTRVLPSARHICKGGAAHHASAQISDKRVLAVVVRIVEVVLLLYEVFGWSGIDVFGFVSGAGVGADASTVASTVITQARFVEAVKAWCSEEHSKRGGAGVGSVAAGTTSGGDAGDKDPEAPPHSPVLTRLREEIDDAFVEDCAKQMFCTYSAAAAAAAASAPTTPGGSSDGGAGSEGSCMRLAEFSFLLCDFHSIFESEHTTLTESVRDKDLFVCGRVLAALSSVQHGDLIGGIVAADTQPVDGLLSREELRTLLKADGSGVRVPRGAATPTPNPEVGCLLSDVDLDLAIGGKGSLDVHDVVVLLRSMAHRVEAAEAATFAPLPSTDAAAVTAVRGGVHGAVVDGSGVVSQVPNDPIIPAPNEVRFRALMKEDVGGCALVFDALVRVIAERRSLVSLFVQYAAADLCEVHASASEVATMLSVAAAGGQLTVVTPAQVRRRCRVLSADRLAVLLAATGTAASPYHALGCMQVYGAPIPPSCLLLPISAGGVGAGGGAVESKSAVPVAIPPDTKVMDCGTFLSVFHASWDAALTRYYHILDGPHIRQHEFATLFWQLISTGSTAGAVGVGGSFGDSGVGSVHSPVLTESIARLTPVCSSAGGGTPAGVEGGAGTPGGLSVGEASSATPLPAPIRAALTAGLLPVPFYALWSAFDEDGSGCVSDVEMYSALAQCGVKLSAAEVRVLFNTADSNHDGKVQNVGVRE